MTGFRGGNHNAHKEGGGMKRSRNSREIEGGAMMGTWCVIFKSHVIERERERVSDCERARVS